ncbi:MAG: penicillin-binding protein 2 [Acidobacteria bacterium]|nr:penicillin-binding protein 2 [Acidobacteriota bacterium]
MRQHAEPPRLLRDDTKFASGKIAFFQYITVAIFVFLIASFWDLQVSNPEIYSEAALRNSVKSLPILAPRGKILDRDGRLIVDNHASFTLILNRQLLKQEHLRPIADGLNIDYDELVAKVRRFSSRPKYDRMVVKQELTRADVAFVTAHSDPSTFPEMELIQAYRRLYPHDGLAAHVIGYVGEVSELELDSADFAKYNQGDVIGKAGLERQYNDVLIGSDGQYQVRVDNLGHEREEIGRKEAVPGQSLQLTLDLDLQAVAELAMDGKRGAVVALDPRTGEVLAMVSRPTFDASMFAGRFSTADWAKIANDPDKPLLNRAIQAQKAPGSTFKPIMAIAGLETGDIDDGFRVHCSGGAYFYGHPFKCHIKTGHGDTDLHKAIAQSCDVFFYNVGNRMGIDKIAQYAEALGLGHKTGIDLPAEASGLIPSSKWKMRTFRQKWYAGETISVSIGQGQTVVTPLQLAAAIGALSMGGELHKPHLLLGKNDAGSRFDLKAENVSRVVSGMSAVVNEWGTGTIARLPGIEVCGKTGTAQLASNEYLKANKANLGQSMQDDAWFVGFAPRHNPEIVVVAYYENGVHGIRAAPIVRDVIKSYFDKKVRKQQLEVAKNSVPQLLPRPATDQPTVAGPPEVLEPRKKEEPEIIE